jgi:DDE superfamily endonuclease
MTLLAAWLAIVSDWSACFPQRRTFRRGVRQALGALVCLGRRCLSRIIWTNGGQHRSWSSEYFLHSRRQWQPQTFFAPVLRRALAYCSGRLLGVAVDDTRLRKKGRLIPKAFYQRDPPVPTLACQPDAGLALSASFAAGAALPAGQRGVLPIRFEEVSWVKKPSRKATKEAMTKLYNLSQRFVQTSRQLRQQLDAAAGRDKILVLATDGGFCNCTCLRAPHDRTELIGRARKDARLCFRAPEDCRRFYDTPMFTPEQVRQDDSRSGKQTKMFYGGKRRKVRYKRPGGGAPKVHWRRICYGTTESWSNRRTRAFVRNGR